MRKFAPTINRIEQTITISRAFQIAAGNVNSAEYQEYLRMKEQYPNFTIIVHQKERKEADTIFGKLTYEGMKDFIRGYEATQEAYDAAIEELEDLRSLYKGQRGAYLMIKKWFLTKYQDEVDRRKAVKEERARQKRESDFLYHPATANN
ncbi:MAG: hypothetical protein IJC56_08830 [Clostridia bacterium]|nr:hypothetical protein [Clostridia bacterium]